MDLQEANQNMLYVDSNGPLYLSEDYGGELLSFASPGDCDPHCAAAQGRLCGGVSSASQRDPCRNSTCLSREDVGGPVA